MNENNYFPVRDDKHDAVVPPKPLTGSGSVNRVGDDTISIEFTSTYSQNSNSNEIEVVQVAKKARKRPFYRWYKSNKS